MSLKSRYLINGIGFDPLAQDELSYGLKNMEDRVRDMAGTFKLLTAPRKGSSIEITIPLLEGEDHEDIVTWMTNQMVRLGLKSYPGLQDDIAEVSEAVNGKEGVEQALASRPDVIIMDIVMPEMNGIEATLAILKEWPEAKILILTSYLDNEKNLSCSGAGAHDTCLRLPALKKFFVLSKKWPRENLPLKQRSARKWSIIVTISSFTRI